MIIKLFAHSMNFLVDRFLISKSRLVSFSPAPIEPVPEQLIVIRGWGGVEDDKEDVDYLILPDSLGNRDLPAVSVLRLRSPPLISSVLRETATNVLELFSLRIFSFNPFTQSITVSVGDRRVDERIDQSGGVEDKLYI